MSGGETFDPSNYKLIKITPSKRKYKKYQALLRNVRTGRTKTVHFGDSRYQQYKDSTGIGKYSHKDHLDLARRRRYYQRHGRKAPKWSPKWFSHKYLW